MLRVQASPTPPCGRRGGTRGWAPHECAWRSQQRLSFVHGIPTPASVPGPQVVTRETQHSLKICAAAKPRKGGGGGTAPVQSARPPPAPQSKAGGGGGATGKPAASDSLLFSSLEVPSLTLPTGPPGSEEEALKQAGASLAASLAFAAKAAEPMTLKGRQRLAGGKAGKKGGGGVALASAAVRAQVEVPLRDEGPKAQVALVKALLQSAVSSIASSQTGSQGGPFASAVIFFASSAAAEAASALSLDGASLEIEAFSLGSTQVVPKASDLVLVVGPTPEQAKKAQLVVNSAGKRPVLLLNPGWASDVAAAEVDGDIASLRSLETAFQVAYCFMPLAFQGMLGQSSGGLICAGPGLETAPGKASWGEGYPWVLFKDEGKENKRIAVLRKRPNNEELQNLMYASMASESPVSKSIQFMRSLLGRPA